MKQLELFACASYPCSAEPVADSSPATYSAGKRLGTSSGTTTASRYYAKGKKTVYSRSHPSSAMSEHSLVKGTPQAIRDWLTSFRGDSPASPSVSPEDARERTTSAICGPQLSTSSVRYDRASSSWRTCEVFFGQVTLGESWETWPKAGMTQDGAFYPLPNWERRIAAIDSGLLPTIHAQEPGWKVGGAVEVVDKDGNPPEHWNQRWYDKKTGRLVQKGLTQVVQMWATPSSSDATRGGTLTPNMTGTSLAQQVKTPERWPTPQARDHFPPHRPEYIAEKRAQGHGMRNLNDVIGGQLNPAWVEWLMGWPIGWTELKPLATDRFRQWQQQHGAC